MRSTCFSRLLLPTLLVLAASPLFAQYQPEVVEPAIIPRPARVVMQPGSYTITADTRILIDTAFGGAEATALYLAEMIGGVSSFTPRIETGTGERAAHNSITLRLLAPTAESSPESYTLRVFPGGVLISATSEQGLFHGVQTLRQLLPARFESSAWRDTTRVWTLPNCLIMDRPRFAWRGLLLDCCRHFMDVDFIKHTIDMLALLKMNRLHWHLTEDQGWRIEIRAFPELTHVGAWRRNKDGSTYGGFYTQQQIREIVRYASERHVTVVPEIEMPGHALAALAAYPHLSCTGGPFDVANDWGVFKDIFCAGKDDTFRFLETVLDEVMELFPSEYVHIGGDEAPKFRWEHCEACQRRMREEGLADEHALQSWFIARIERYLRAHGRKLIGWDEILEGGLAPNATVQSWRGMDGARAAAKSGHDAIVSPTSHAYFDYDVSNIDLRKVYGFEAIPEGLTPDEARHILGGECNMWTEHAPQAIVESKIYPRILAMSEVLWSPTERRDWDSFHARVRRYYERLDSLGVDYGYEAPPVLFEPRHSDSSLTIALSSGQAGLQLLYALGQEVGDGTPYRTALQLHDSGTVAVVAMAPGGKRSTTYRLRYDRHAAFRATVTLGAPPHASYTAGGAQALTDGLRASTAFRDGRWQGHEEGDLDVLLDFGRALPLHELRAGFLHYQQAWIFLPRECRWSWSMDGTTFHSLGKSSFDADDRAEEAMIREASIDGGGVHARYLRLEATSMGRCPAWHAGAGGKAWIFIDEIIVR